MQHFTLSMILKSKVKSRGRHAIGRRNWSPVQAGLHRPGVCATIDVAGNRLSREYPAVDGPIKSA
jgi:hypothetical protein